MIVVFSKDRAFQLEACLRTLRNCCEDIGSVPVRVLWTASSSDHHRAYEILEQTLRSESAFPVEFVEEAAFRTDLIAILGQLPRNSVRIQLLRGSAWLRRAVTLLTKFLFSPVASVLFVVDDTLFLKNFNFSTCARHLQTQRNCLAFSLRLGEGLGYFYMGNREQKVPDLTTLDPTSGICQFRWADADGDFGYPLEVSSSLLKLSHLFPRLLRKEWKSPNTLEMALANMAGRYRDTHPTLLTFRQPHAVAVPLNIVQKDFTENRHGGKDRYHPDELCRLFLSGVRADLSRLDQVAPAAVHIELDL